MVNRWQLARQVLSRLCSIDLVSVRIDEQIGVTGDLITRRLGFIDWASCSPTRLPESSNDTYCLLDLSVP
jgi:hypothetical protein